MIRHLIVPILAMLLILAGCAPGSFEEGEAYYADQYHVRDAAARRVDTFWYLRFNQLMISDLDDAITAGRQGLGLILATMATAQVASVWVIVAVQTMAITIKIKATTRTGRIMAMARIIPVAILITATL